MESSNPSHRIAGGRRAFLTGTAAMAAASLSCVRRSSSGVELTGTTPLSGGQLTTASGHEHGTPLHPLGSVPIRPLGATGVQVSAIGIGGSHIGQPADDEDAVRIVRTAVDEGLTFMDNCWDYHGGRSEERMGKALLDGYRRRVFLMTKIDGRTREAARQQIEDSLRRLRTDVIDLLQIHEVIRSSDPFRCFAERGAVEAIEEAKQAGKIRFVGFTGHKDPQIHLQMLEQAEHHGYRFDAVQMPLNVMDAHYQSFEREVLPVLVKTNVAVLGMKCMGNGDILKSGLVTADECLRYALSLPTSVVITGCDSLERVHQAARVARNFRPLSEEECKELLARTAEAASQGKYERFKSADVFDGTVRNPHWLETAHL